MATPLSVSAGSDASWSTTLRNAGAFVAYPADATLDAVVFAGDGTPTLFSPAVAWTPDAATGAPLGQVRLDILGNQTAALDPAEYRIQVWATSGPVRSLAYDGILRVTGTAGSQAPALRWASSHDLALRSPHIVALLASRKVDSAGFGDVIEEVTARLRRMMLDRYKPRAGFVYTRQNTPVPYLGGFDLPTPLAAIPSTSTLAAALDAGGLILEDRIRDIAARFSIALILRRQAIAAGGSEYIEAADDEEARAMKAWKCHRAQVDLDADGRPDALIGIDITLLPEGTSP